MLQRLRRPAFFTRIHTWSQTHKKATFALIGCGVLLISGTTAFLLSYQKPEPEQKQTIVAEPEPEPEPVHYFSLLTGEEVASEAAVTAPTTAIMIENSPDARPQSGLKGAGVVYEAIAEGGITRFLAIYQNNKPDLIGPVRSLRMYYVDWLAPYNASVAHVGGSHRALQEVRNGSYRDIDQFFNAGSYWRASDRYAPHNVYTSFDNLDALNKAKGYKQSKFTSFPRTDGKPAAEPTARTVTINFSSPSYNTVYTYDKKNNRYLRSLGGAPHNDRESGRLAPSVVLALRVNMRSVFEDGYREQIDTTGSGSAVLFQNGVAKEVTWHKKSRSAPLLITDKAGKDIPLIRGQTWIAAVPNSGGDISWQP